jgi:hypothetical protein
MLFSCKHFVLKNTKLGSLSRRLAFRSICGQVVRFSFKPPIYRLKATENLSLANSFHSTWHTMPLFIATLLASLACFDFWGFVTASPAPQSDALLPRAATLSPNAQLLVNQTIATQQATGNQWNLLAAEALLKLVQYVGTDGWPSSTCTLDNVYVRREW